MYCVAGHQPNLYPYGGFFAKAASTSRFVMVDNTQYVKKQYQNRNRIKLSDGNSHWLSIPANTAGRFKQAINEVEIKKDTNWQKKHARTLEVNYGKCPYFETYYPHFRELLEINWDKLVEYNLAVIETCFRLLGTTPRIVLASELGITGKGTDLIAEICRKTGADAYLHGKHGRDYVDFDRLESAGVRNLIQDFTPVCYSQPWGDFIGNLSILDLLFNCGPNTLETILKGNRILDAQTSEPVRLPV